MYAACAGRAWGGLVFLSACNGGCIGFVEVLMPQRIVGES